jgi:hypothetical protein
MLEWCRMAACIKRPAAWAPLGDRAMSNAGRPTRIAPPPLVEGQRLDQVEFHRRYEAMPPETRAELIDGVVCMPSPVGPEHGRAHAPALV